LKKKHFVNENESDSFDKLTELMKSKNINFIKESFLKQNKFSHFLIEELKIHNIMH